MLLLILLCSAIIGCGGNADPGVASGNADASADASASDANGDGKAGTGTNIIIDGLFAFRAYEILIIGHKVIPVGDPEHGSGWPGKPILDIQFMLTNKGDSNTDALMSFITYMNVYRDEERQGRCTMAGYYNMDGSDRLTVTPGDTFVGGIKYVLEPGDESAYVFGNEPLKEGGMMVLPLEGT